LTKLLNLIKLNYFQGTAFFRIGQGTDVVDVPICILHELQCQTAYHDSAFKVSISQRMDFKSKKSPFGNE
jgi:hypothetical protein